MSDYSMSITIGEGNIGHNSNALRRQKLDNVDSSRTLYNVNLVHQDIKDAYHFLFDESVKNYNLTQKRSDRRISDYYKKIAKSKKEKPFYEFVIQIGNVEKHPDMDSCNEIYKEFVDLVQYKYPQIYIFGAYIHNDEATPHLHLDYIPYGTYEKGLSKRVSLSKAMSQMGYSFTGNDEREKGLYKEWRNDLLKDFELICGQYYINREIMNNHEKHEPNVQLYKERVELEKSIKDLTQQKEHIAGTVESLEKERVSLTNENSEIIQEIASNTIELIQLEDKIVTNPISKYIDDSGIRSTVSRLNSEFEREKLNYDDLTKEKEALEKPFPPFDSTWLTYNVEYVPPKNPFMGKPEPGYYKISEKEWENKISKLNENAFAFKKLSDLYTSLKSTFRTFCEKYTRLYDKAHGEMFWINRIIESLKQLPIYSTWKDIVNNAKDASYFKKEYNKLKENFDKRIGQKDEIIVQLGDKKDRLQDFYERFLFVLSISKIKNEESALDVALKPYDWDTRWAIMQDLYNLQNASYKEIILQKGDKGYGYYSSKEEGSVYLGDEFDRDQLEALYPDANFTREVSTRDVSRSGWSR